MNATRLILLRHGETALNQGGRFRGRADPPLTLEGERQARSAADTLFELHPMAVYTSPRRRAKETSVPVCGAFGLEATVVDAVDDFDYGDWTEKTAQEAEIGWPSIFATWQKDPGAAEFPGGESVRVALARVTAFLEAVSRMHPGETVVAITHDAVVRCVACAVLNAPLVAYHRITIGLASTTGLLLAEPVRLLWMNRGASAGG